MSHPDPLVRKVLRRGLPAGRLLFSAFGVAVGLLFLVLCVQLILGLQLFVRSPETGDGAYLVVNKVLRDGFLTGPEAVGFKDSDMVSIRSQPFVLDAAPLSPNVFKVFAALGFSGGGIGSEVFFEALPQRFLDKVPEGWDWSPDRPEEAVPILLSRDFLNLYNFGFAGSRGLPQVTDATAGSVPLMLTISGPLGWKNVRARIGGFSDRISSIMVPESFVKWANHTLVGPQDPPPLRLVIRVKDPSDPALRAYLENQGWETNKDRLRLSRMALLAQILLGVLGVIGAIMAGLGLFLVQISMRLYVTDHKEDLQLLIHLGASPQLLLQGLARVQAWILLPAGCFAAIGAVLLAFFGEGLFKAQGLDVALFAPLGLVLIPLTAVLHVWGVRSIARRLPC